MNFSIRQNDDLPKLFAELWADFDSSVPEQEQIIYEFGDEINFYIRIDGWQTAPADVIEVIDGGRGIRVRVDMSDFVEAADTYRAYFRNETKKISFPTKENFEVEVVRSGH